MTKRSPFMQLEYFLLDTNGNSMTLPSREGFSQNVADMSRGVAWLDAPYKSGRFA